MASDGSLIFDTKVDTGGVEGALKKIAGIAAAGGALADVTKTGMEFEASMSKVAAVSGAAGKTFQDLTDLAREYGASTVFSSSECADALNYMAMAGWNAEQMTSGLPGVLNLAAASGEDLAATSDIVTDALTAFGMQAEEAGHFADILATASSKSNTNVSMMGETFKYVAPVAGALGYSAEDVAVAVGLMANSGIKASQAGTSLRTILSNLTEPTDKQAAAMDALGISLTDSEGNMKSLDTLLQQMRASFSGLNESEKASYASIIAGQEGMSGLLAIVNAAESDFSSLKNSIYDCDGACDTMAKTMTDNVSGEIKTLKSMAEELELSLYDMFKPMLKEAIPKVQDGVKWITEHLDEIIAFAKPVGAALVAIFAVNQVTKYSKAVIGMVKGIGTAVKSNPLGAILTTIELITLAASVAVGYFQAWDKHLEEVYENAAKLPEKMEELKENTAEAATAWEDMRKASEEAVSNADFDYSEIDNMKKRLSELVNADGTIREGAEDEVRSLLDNINEYTGACYEVSNGLITKNDEVIGSYQQLSSEIDSLMIKSRGQAILAAYQDDYSEAVKGKEDAQYGVITAKEEINDLRLKINAAYADLKNYESAAGNKFGQLSEAELKTIEEKSTTLAGLRDNLKEQESILKDNETLLAKYESMETNYSNLASALQQNDTTAIEKFTDSLKAGIVRAGDAGSIPAIEENIRRLEALRDRAKSLYNNNPTEENRKEYNYYQSMLFDQIGEWHKYAKEFYDTGKKNSESAAEGVVDGIEENQDDIKAASTTSGECVGDGLVDGINSKKGCIAAAVNGIAGMVSSVFNSALAIHSPSRVMAEAGMYAAEGVVSGLQYGSIGVSAASEELADSLLSGFNTADIYSRLTAPSGIPVSVNNNSSIPSSSSLPAASSQPAPAPSFIIYIGNEEIRNFVIDTITDENANSGGFSV